jgi:O-methyltransferase
MKKQVIKTIQYLLKYFNTQLVKINNNQIPIDIEKKYHSVMNHSNAYTMTSFERMYALVGAVEYISNNNIKGDIVECGVWRGGSMLAVANTLIDLDQTDRNLWLYDTFEGMPLPTDEDFSCRTGDAKVKFEETKIDNESSDWCRATLDDVKHTLSLSKYPVDNIHYIKGMVETTIPAIMPEKIALLRLDTDWYESTKHELKNLYPLLVPGGVLIIDDYGHWEGCRKAVDEYFETLDKSPLLIRVDYTGRVAIKPV